MTDKQEFYSLRTFGPHLCRNNTAAAASNPVGKHCHMSRHFAGGESVVVRRATAMYGYTPVCHVFKVPTV